VDFMKDIRLQRSSQQPLYLQLYRQIKDMIEDGRLKPESKLPAIRELARMLHVNAVTVVNAYNKLEIDGVVFLRPAVEHMFLPMLLRWLCANTWRPAIT